MHAFMEDAKMVDKLLNGNWTLREFQQVLRRYFDMINRIPELYLTLTYNNPDIHELITTRLGRYKDTKFL